MSSTPAINDFNKENEYFVLKEGKIGTWSVSSLTGKIEGSNMIPDFNGAREFRLFSDGSSIRLEKEGDGLVMKVGRVHSGVYFNEDKTQCFYILDVGEKIEGVDIVIPSTPSIPSIPIPSFPTLETQNAAEEDDEDDEETEVDEPEDDEETEVDEPEDDEEPEEDDFDLPSIASPEVIELDLGPIEPQKLEVQEAEPPKILPKKRVTPEMKARMWVQSQDFEVLHLEDGKFLWFDTGDFKNYISLLAFE